MIKKKRYRAIEVGSSDLDVPDANHPTPRRSSAGSPLALKTPARIHSPLFDNLGPNWFRPGREDMVSRVQGRVGLVKNTQKINC